MSRRKGHGHGLSISRSIVVVHGGWLQAAPNEPHGAIFRFVLPIEVRWRGRDRPARRRGVMVDVTDGKRADGERQPRQWTADSMDRVNLAIQGTNDLEQMMTDVLDATLSIFQCDRTWLVYPCDPETMSHTVKMQRTRPEFAFHSARELPVDPDTAAVFRAVRASSGRVQFRSHSGHPLPAEQAKRLGIQARMAMALYPKGAQPYMFGLSQCPYAPGRSAKRSCSRRSPRAAPRSGRRLQRDADDVGADPASSVRELTKFDRYASRLARTGPAMMPRPMIRRKTLTVLVYTPSRRWR